MAIKANITIDQGSDFSTTVNITDGSGSATDLTGYTGAAQIRKHWSSTTSYDFTVTIPAPETDGIVQLALSSAQTSAIPPGRYNYDIELTSSGNVVSRIVEGLVTVTPEITR